MSQRKSTKYSRPPKQAKLFDPPLLLLLGISALGYYMIWVAIYAVFGGNVATWLATPLWGVPVFLITRWDRIRTQQDVGWRELIKFPKLKLWKLAVVALTIYLTQLFTGVVVGLYLYKVRPDVQPEGVLEGLQAIRTEWGSIAIATVGGGLAYFLAGYVAGKLSPQPYLAPYAHAAVGEFIAYFINYAWIQFLYVCECGTTPTQEDIGVFALMLPPTMSLSLIGAWVATRRPFRRFKQRLNSLPTTGHRYIGLDASTAHTPPGDSEPEGSKSEGLKLRIFHQSRGLGKKRKRRGNKRRCR